MFLQTSFFPFFHLLNPYNLWGYVGRLHELKSWCFHLNMALEMDEEQKVVYNNTYFLSFLGLWRENGGPRVCTRLKSIQQDFRGRSKNHLIEHVTIAHRMRREEGA